MPTGRRPTAADRSAIASAMARTWISLRPLAITNCLNFGNPERGETPYMFTEAVEGMAEACEALGAPVVSGNVSLYNETEGRPILPTPTIGAVGVINDISKAVGSRLTQGGLGIVLIGATTGWLGQSLYLREEIGRAHV